jgi:electron transport complex protein RnfG
MASRIPETPRLVLTLTVAGLLSGTFLVGVDAITRPMIAENRAAFYEKAAYDVLPGAERLERFEWRDGALAKPAAGAGEEGAAREWLYAGYLESGELAGYAIPGDGAGYQDTIRLLYGFDPEKGRIIGMFVLESKETPGLGDQIYKNEDFVAAFRDLAVEPEVVLVKGSAAAANEVAGITGATVSSRAVVKIINQANERWLERLSKGE